MATHALMTSVTSKAGSANLDQRTVLMVICALMTRVTRRTANVCTNQRTAMTWTPAPLILATLQQVFAGIKQSSANRKILAL
jgi:hypothetical protein